MKPALVFALALIQFTSLKAGTEAVPVFVRDSDTGRPVEGATVVAVRRLLTPTANGRVSAAEREERLATMKTDANGFCEFAFETVACEYGFCVRDLPKGYHKAVQSDRRAALADTWTARRDLCTKPFEFYAYAVLNPIALKHFEERALNFRPNGNAFALDMLKGEWLPPLGKGERADVTFTRRPRRFTGSDTGVCRPFRDEVVIAFPGTDNGIVEMPKPRGAGLPVRTAPTSGYAASYVAWTGLGTDRKPESSDDWQKNFCFRIRTERDAEGRIISARYGKICNALAIEWGALLGDAADSAITNAARGVRIGYALNPTPLDTNLEEVRR